VSSVELTQTNIVYSLLFTIYICSTAVEWCYLLQTIQKHELTGQWTPHVSLDDGLRAVQMGIVATSQLVNELDDE
jgi:hypothetical protein